MQTQDLALLNALALPDRASVDAALTDALQNFNRKVVVLDDDPTGVQTVHGVSVYTTWEEEALRAGFSEQNSLFYLLTNSRSFTGEQTAQVHREIGTRLCAIAREIGRDFLLISRSDSTLRGHYPLETQTLRQAVEACSSRRYSGEILLPFFQEGGRFTVNNIHYVREGDRLMPAGQTEFARDKSFGYQSSHMGDYVAEKTQGAYARESCTYISLEDLRGMRVEQICRQLQEVRDFNKVIVNAADYLDVKVFALALIKAMDSGKEFLFRTAAALPKVMGGVPDQALLNRSRLIDPANRNGGIVLIGSHVSKTTRQFEALRQCRAPMAFLEFNQHRVLEPGGLDQEVAQVVARAEAEIARGTNVAVYTRRERFDLDTGDKEAQLRVSTQISDAVTSVIGKLTVRPNFIIAKGGITSSDVGTKALGVRRALVMGQVQPGIPVWMTGPESKFPSMPYIIFPGNVGEDRTLREIVDTLSL